MTATDQTESPEWTRYLRAWNVKTTKQVERELASMRKYVQRNSAHIAILAILAIIALACIAGALMDGNGDDWSGTP